MVTEDKKWVMRKLSKLLKSKRDEMAQTVVKLGIMARNDFLGMDFKEICNFCCQQLSCLVIDQNMSELSKKIGVLFQMIITKSYTCIVTRQKRQQLGWEVLMISPYNSALPPRVYLFFPLQNFINDRKAWKSRL